MHKQTRIKLIVALVLLIYGCAEPVRDYPITDKDFQKGTKGLTIEFIPNAPPDKVFETQDETDEKTKSLFDVSVEIWNKGAYKLSSGYVTANLENQYMCIYDSDKCVEPIDKGTNNDLADLRAQRTALLIELHNLDNAPYIDNDVDLVNQKRIETIKIDIKELDIKIKDESEKVTINSGITQTLDALDGRELSSPEGTSQIIEFKAQALELDELSVQHTSPVILTTCYAYTTEVAEDICIDPDPTSDRDKACTMNDITLKDQGAPVAVTKIEPRIIPSTENSRLQFLIYIENKGDGRIIGSDMIDSACTASKMRNEDWNRVKLAEFSFQNTDYRYVYGQTGNTIVCDTNPLRLKGEADYIKCTFDDDADISQTTPAFTTQVNIKLDYGYLKSITKNVIIEQVD